MRLPGGYTEHFRTLLQEIQSYLLLQKRYVSLDVADKLVVLLSTVAIAVVCFVLGAMILFFLTFALAYWIGQLAGSLALGFLIICGVLLAGMVIFLANRDRWIIRPLARMMVGLFASKEESIDNEEEEEASDEQQTY